MTSPASETTRHVRPHQTTLDVGTILVEYRVHLRMAHVLRSRPAVPQHERERRKASARSTKREIGGGWDAQENIGFAFKDNKTNLPTRLQQYDI